MQLKHHLNQHPQRAALHNEVHARPPQALTAHEAADRTGDRTGSGLVDPVDGDKEVLEAELHHEPVLPVLFERVADGPRVRVKRAGGYDLRRGQR